MKKRKLKLSLNKDVVARLQKERLRNIFGGENKTQLTCMPGCVDPNSIDLCELSNPCYNTFENNCHTAGGQACD